MSGPQSSGPDANRGELRPGALNHSQPTDGHPGSRTTHTAGGPSLSGGGEGPYRSRELPGILALHEYAFDVYMDGLVEWARRWDEGYEAYQRIIAKPERRPRARRS